MGQNMPQFGLRFPFLRNSMATMLFAYSFGSPKWRERVLAIYNDLSPLHIFYYCGTFHNLGAPHYLFLIPKNVKSHKLFCSSYTFYTS